MLLSVKVETGFAKLSNGLVAAICSKFVLPVLLGIFSCAAFSDEDMDYTGDRSMLEVGALMVGQFSADYRGSEYYSARVIPLPYLFYHSKIIKVGRGGVRGEFWSTPRFQLNVSVDGSVGGQDDNNPLRTGMPELESAVEFGPSVDIMLSGESMEEGWSLKIPLRAVFSLSSDGINHIGYIFNPRLSWRRTEIIPDWRLSFHLGVLFADHDYHNYFYGVTQDQALTWRPEYDADAGYSGAYARVNLYRKWENWRFGVSFRYDNLSGTAFTSSPLYETPHYGSVSFVVIRRFWTKYFD